MVAIALLAGAFVAPSLTRGTGITFATRTTADGLGTNWVRALLVSGSKVYAGTSGGLSISTDGGVHFTNKTTSNGLGSNTVRAVFDSGSTIYVATHAGVSVSTDGGTSFTNYTTASGLPANNVNVLFVSGLDLYAGTASGLGIYAAPVTTTTSPPPTTTAAPPSGGSGLVIPRIGVGVKGITPRQVARYLGILIPSGAKVAIAVDSTSVKRCANQGQAGSGYKVVSLKSGTCLVDFAIRYSSGRIVRKTVRLPAA